MIEEFVVQKWISRIVKDTEDNIAHLVIEAVNSIDDEKVVKCDIDLERAKNALIKEFAPAQVMTLEELRDIREPMVVWVQDSDQYVAIRPEEFHRIGKTPYSSNETVEYANGFDYACDYGRTYIFWTAKPTEEQQAKVVWMTEKREEDHE